MHSGQQGHSLSRHLPPLPADVAKRIVAVLAAEADRRTDPPRGSAAQAAVPLQRSAGGQSLASYVPRQRRTGLT